MVVLVIAEDWNPIPVRVPGNPLYEYSYCIVLYCTVRVYSTIGGAVVRVRVRVRVRVPVQYMYEYEYWISSFFCILKTSVRVL